MSNYDDINSTIILNNTSSSSKTNIELKTEILNIWNTSVLYNDTSNVESSDNEEELIEILKTTKTIAEIEKQINHEIQKPINNNDDVHGSMFDVTTIVALFESLDRHFQRIPNPNTEIGDTLLQITTFPPSTTTTFPSHHPPPLLLLLLLLLLKFLTLLPGSGKTITYLRKHRKKLTDNFKKKMKSCLGQFIHTTFIIIITNSKLDMIFSFSVNNDNNNMINVNINGNHNIDEILKLKEYRDIVATTITDNFIKPIILCQGNYCT